MRYPELGDATDIYACVQSSEFPEQLPLKEMETVEAIIKWIKMLQTNWQDGRGYSWVAEMPDTKELIGQVTLSKMKEANKYAIAFWISPKHWLKGYAAEAVEGVIACGFEELGVQKIWASAGKWNQASQGVLGKIGMTQVGENPVGYTSKGEPIATLEYEIEKRSWEERKYS